MIITSIAGFSLLALAAVSSSLSMDFQKIAQSQTNFFDERTSTQKSLTNLHAITQKFSARQPKKDF